MSAARPLRALALALACSGLGGCAWISSWFSKAPRPAAPAVAAPTAADTDVEPASAALAACSNYAQAVQAAPFPREAIIRGIDAGTATVRFLVAGTTVTVLSVTSSNPAFGNAASDIVRTLTCRVDRPTRFDVPFSWRTTR